VSRIDIEVNPELAGRFATDVGDSDLIGNRCVEVRVGWCSLDAHDQVWRYLYHRQREIDQDSPVITHVYNRILFGPQCKGCYRAITVGTELEFVIMVIAVSCVKLLSAHNSTQHTSRKHKV
jgi:hypothetical protein